MVAAVLILLCSVPLAGGPLAGNTWLVPLFSLGAHALPDSGWANQRASELHVLPLHWLALTAPAPHAVLAPPLQ